MEPVLFTVRVPFPGYNKKSKKTKNKLKLLATMNNVLDWKRFYETKIKNEFKQNLIDFYIPEPEKKYESLTIEYRILRNSRRKIDPDSAGFAMKWIQDTLEKVGYVEDDRTIQLKSFPTQIINSPETLIEFRIRPGSEKWD